MEVVRLLASNREALDERSLVPSFLGRWADATRHAFRRNTRAGTRRHIASHDDLSNDFFRTFLDESMTYSCAVYRSPGESLEEARRRVEAAGLAERVSIEPLDYRDVRGCFDRIVSVEMLEAAGHAHLPGFFAACDRLLAPGGRLVLQFIWIGDDHYERYRRDVDWIRMHVFPGGHLPSRRAVERAAARGSRLTVAGVEEIGPHYATTLAEWRRRFLGNRQRVLDLGFDEAFLRKWLYYLCYCEGAFRAGVIGDVQMVLSRPGEAAAP